MAQLLLSALMGLMIAVGSYSKMIGDEQCLETSLARLGPFGA